MRELVNDPIFKFINNIRQNNQGQFTNEQMNAMNNFDHANQAWEALTRPIFVPDPTPGANGGAFENVCGFKGVTPEGEPTKVVENCNNMCEDIKDISLNGPNGGNIKQVLEEFLFFVQGEFDQSTLSNFL